MPRQPKTPPSRSIRPEADRQQAARDQLLERLLRTARTDDRVLAVLDYGSTSEGRGDAWSDIDLALVIRPGAWTDFENSWRQWLASCGPVLLGFVSFVGHPWAVIATDAAPVRVDLHLYGGAPDHDLRAALLNWPNSPTSVASMLLFDRNDALGDDVARLVGRSLAPEQSGETFTDIAGHFWYYLHRTWSKLRRDSAWGVRWNLTFIVTGNLCALLRLESGATGRWAASDAADGIESAISKERLEQLNRCIPTPDPASLAPTLRTVAEVGADACERLAAQTGQPWPDELARQMIELLADQEAHPFAKM